MYITIVRWHNRCDLLFGRTNLLKYNITAITNIQKPFLNRCVPYSNIVRYIPIDTITPRSKYLRISFVKPWFNSDVIIPIINNVNNVLYSYVSQ